MHVLAAILSKVGHLFIFEYIFNWVTLSGMEICPLLIYLILISFVMAKSSCEAHEQTTTSGALTDCAIELF